MNGVREANLKCLTLFINKILNKSKEPPSLFKVFYIIHSSWHSHVYGQYGIVIYVYVYILIMYPTIIRVNMIFVFLFPVCISKCSQGVDTLVYSSYITEI